jgi:DNA-binding IclR family transcriptional regulator
LLADSAAKAVVMEKTVVKGLKVIEALANSSGARSLTDLANECGLTKSNAHRLLKTLETCGYVRHDPTSKAFEATLRPWDLGNRIFNRTELRIIALPYLEELAARTKETTHLSIFDGGEVIYIGKVDSVHAVRTYVEIGDRAPSYCCATGKAMLAHMPDEIVREATRNMKRFTKNTIVSPAKVKADLELIRSRGYSMTEGEWQEGVLGFAMAIKTPGGEIAGAIGVAGPDERMRKIDLKQTVAALRSAARKIEAELAAVATTLETPDADSIAKTTGTPRNRKGASAKREKQTR